MLVSTTGPHEQLRKALSTLTEQRRHKLPENLLPDSESHKQKTPTEKGVGGPIFHPGRNLGTLKTTVYTEVKLVPGRAPSRTCSSAVSPLLRHLNCHHQIHLSWILIIQLKLKPRLQ